jgi:hypothetical protein
MKRFISSRVVYGLKWGIIFAVIGHFTHDLVVDLIGLKTYQILTNGTGLIVLIVAILATAFIVYNPKSTASSDETRV